MAKKIIFTITNDPDYDQRMQRICKSLHEAGYDIILAGRKMRKSTGLKAAYRVKRMKCLFHKGPLQYLEYHVRLFCWLLFQRTDIICAIDIDTVLPVYFASSLKRTKRVLDAHEYFSELKEVVTRPVIHRCWKKLEQFAIPRFPKGYTVGQQIANQFHISYGVTYNVIRNVPFRTGRIGEISVRKNAILYQGAINEARGLEFLIPAMQTVNAELHIYGTGNFEQACKALVTEFDLDNKVKFFGMVSPDLLLDITPQYKIGVNLVEPIGLNQYFSLANKFFDYIQAGLPQVTMNFPEYAEINNRSAVGVLLDELTPYRISSALNLLLGDIVLYEQLVNNCNALKEIFCWEIEKDRLLDFYEKL